MNIAIIDDNEKDSKKLEVYSEKFYSNFKINIRSFKNELDFLSNFKKNFYDIIFIDYFINDTTGLELSRKIRKIDHSVYLIFVSISRDYAIAAYKVKASGYLTKPFTFDEFSEILSILNYNQEFSNRYIEINYNNQNHRFLIRDIIYCDINGHYSQIHTENTEVKRFRIPFQELLDMFSDYPEFLHCYRGCLINMMHVDKLCEMAFVMSNGEIIPFRKKEKAKIHKIYSDFIFERNRNSKKLIY